MSDTTSRSGDGTGTAAVAAESKVIRAQTPALFLLGSHVISILRGAAGYTTRHMHNSPASVLLTDRS